jgi:probable F420-dependent oxidoreductase
MKFGTFLMQTSGSGLAGVARRAEELGFESLWIPEHILMPVKYASRYPYGASGRMPAPPETPLHDPMLALAYVAALTTKIRLATGVFVLPLRNPYATAKAVASLDNLSGGRFMFGIGIGWLEEEFRAVGMDFADRARRTREYLGLMRELWTSDNPVFHGKTLELEGFKFNPKPIQKPHPPIIFGGHTEPALKRAARLGDGWYGIAEDIGQAGKIIVRLREIERAEKRAKPLEITLSPRLGGELKPDEVRRFAELGADRLIVATGMAARDAITGMERLHDQVMSKL